LLQVLTFTECRRVALANFTNINYDFILQSALLCFHCFLADFSLLSHTDFPLLQLCFWQLCEYVLRVCLWRNLINFTLLEKSRVCCQKSVQMINELINMRQKFGPHPCQMTATLSQHLAYTLCGSAIMHYVICKNFIA